jgi:hypothetical protein
VIFSAWNRKKMLGTKSYRETMLNCAIQSFARKILDDISSVKLLAAND